jgi:hypothetical protein
MIVNIAPQHDFLRDATRQDIQEKQRQNTMHNILDLNEYQNEYIFIYSRVLLMPLFCFMRP